MDLVRSLGFTISVTVAQKEQLSQMNKFASANPDSGALAKIWPSSAFFQEVRTR
jgi:hypothetical protein